MVLLAGGIVCFRFIKAGGPGSVVVYRIDRVIARYPLDRDREFEVQGVEGPVRIRIRDGKARVTFSSCRNQICVNTPPISRPGSQIVCAPNRVIVMIESDGRGNNVDAVGR